MSDAQGTPGEPAPKHNIWDIATHEPEFVLSFMSTSTLPSTSAAPMRPESVAFTPPTILTSSVRPSAGWPWNLATAACASFSCLYVRRTTGSGAPVWREAVVIGPHLLKMAYRKVG